MYHPNNMLQGFRPKMHQELALNAALDIQFLQAMMHCKNVHLPISSVAGGDSLVCWYKAFAPSNISAFSKQIALGSQLRDRMDPMVMDTCSRVHVCTLGVHAQGKAHRLCGQPDYSVHVDIHRAYQFSALQLLISKKSCFMSSKIFVYFSSKPSNPCPFVPVAQVCYILSPNEEVGPGSQSARIDLLFSWVLNAHSVCSSISEFERPGVCRVVPQYVCRTAHKSASGSDGLFRLLVWPEHPGAPRKP